MLLKNFTNQELLSRMEKLVRTERKITHLVLLHIIEIEDRKLFAELGYDGMYSYLTQGLGYSESSAYRRLQSARLLRKVPEVAIKIEEGKLNLSQLTQVQKMIKDQARTGNATLTTEATKQVLKRIENKSRFETERMLAVEFERPVQIHESIKPQKDSSVRIELTLGQEQFAELELAKSLLSHVCHDGTWSEVVAQLAKAFNKKRQPCPSSLTQSFTAAKSPTLKASRQHIPIKVQRAVYKSADGSCTYTDKVTGKRCESKYQLQIDQIHPWSLGGSNSLENLRLLCRTHNNLSWEKTTTKY